VHHGLLVHEGLDDAAVILLDGVWLRLLLFHHHLGTLHSLDLVFFLEAGLRVKYVPVVSVWVFLLLLFNVASDVQKAVVVLVIHLKVC
jgi:hypothetical protein